MTTTPITGSITVTTDEIAELAYLLAVIEDWLLGCGELVHADLESFLPATDGPGRVRGFIDAVGDAGIHLARLLRSTSIATAEGGAR